MGATKMQAARNSQSVWVFQQEVKQFKEPLESLHIVNCLCTNMFSTRCLKEVQLVSTAIREIKSSTLVWCLLMFLFMREVNMSFASNVTFGIRELFLPEKSGTKVGRVK